MTNRLLDPVTLPRFSEMTPAAIGAALDEALAQYEAVVAQLVKDKPDSFETLWLPLERIETALETYWSAVSHLNAMSGEAELRAAHAAGEARLVEAMTRVRQNEELYKLLVALRDTPDFQTRNEADKAAVTHLVRDFELSGVALEPAKRARFAELASELSSLGTAFSNAVLDATDAWSELVTDKAVLAGAPQASMDSFAAAAKAKGEEGWLVTLQAPSISAVLTFVQDRGLRERVYRASGTRASDQGPHAGQFDNSERIIQTLALRKEAAELLGFKDPTEWSLATKMANEASEVVAFLRDLAARAKPSATKDYEAIRSFAAEHMGIDDVQPWDVAFISNRMRQTLFSLDEEAVRAYFPVEQVMEGWRALVEGLFGVQLQQRKDVDLWSEAAAYYDLVDAAGEVIAGLYVDLHARSGKRGGAWMSPARPRLDDGALSGKPVAYLVCNFAPKMDGIPALLSHTDITTLLHETGHCLHHLFTRVDRPSVQGTSGVEWDAIELPSQLLEDFAWDFSILGRMSRHVETGESLPRELYDAMMAARHFQSGMALVRQIEFGLFDMVLHEGKAGNDVLKVLEDIREEVSVVRPPKWHRFPHAFSHIFAGSYASGYYSYLWAEVLAADGFQAFVEKGTIDRSVGDRFRNEVLARGASRPAAESFKAFRGRDPDPQALLIRHGLAA